jgi:Flp pilus assembly protein TadD
VAHPRPARSPGRTALIAAGLAVLAAVPYLARGGLRSFVNLDDNEYVFENAFVRKGLTLDGLRWAFTSFHSGNWHPLTWLSHMLDVSLFGLDATWHHATNVALHALTTALLFTALRRLTGIRWPSALAAALFAVHPLHVESVAWVAERKDVLSGLLFVLVLLAYERCARRRGAWRCLPVAGLLALGLMAKPMLVTTPFVLLLLDFWPLARLRAPAAGAARGPRAPWVSPAAEKLPLLALCAASAVVTFLAQRAGGAVPGLGELAPGARVANAVVSCAWYLVKTFWPFSLAVYYPHHVEVSPWRLVAAVPALTAMTALVIARRRRLPYLAVGWCWFLGMLVPVIGIVQIGGQAMADRYTYLPAIGLFLALAWFLRERGRAPGVLRAVSAAAAALLVPLSAASVLQAGYWRDEETLYRHALAVTSGNWLAHANLGASLVAAKRHEEAMVHLREAIRLAPDYDHAHNNLGVALGALGRPDEAEAAYRRALTLSPRYFEARFNLANAYAEAGRTPEAVAAYREALAVKPDAAAAHYNLARSLAALGRTGESLQHYREALRLDPEAPDVLNNLAWTLATDGSSGRDALLQAVTYARRACELTDHRNPEYLDTLGVALAAAGEFQEAAAAAERALAAAAGNPQQQAEIARRRDLYRDGRSLRHATGGR